jgi:hypothetical protein
MNGMNGKSIHKHILGVAKAQNVKMPKPLDLLTRGFGLCGREDSNLHGIATTRT